MYRNFVEKLLTPAYCNQPLRELWNVIDQETMNYGSLVSSGMKRCLLPAYKQNGLECYTLYGVYTFIYCTTLQRITTPNWPRRVGAYVSHRIINSVLMMLMLSC